MAIKMYMNKDIVGAIIKVRAMYIPASFQALLNKARHKHRTVGNFHWLPSNPSEESFVN